MTESLSIDLFARTSYEFDLPAHLIAQEPCSPRDASRLLIVDRATHSLQEILFQDLVHYLGPGDSLIYNDTKVIPARLLGKRPTGGAVETLLLRPNQLQSNVWEALVRPAKKLPLNAIILFDAEHWATVVDVLAGGRRLLQFHGPLSVYDLLDRQGHIPLPPYIRGGVDAARDRVNYQTIYAQIAGSSAAPTAGLHFTPELLSALTRQGVEQVAVTLHTGLGTFRPVQTDDIRQHVMHDEQFMISEEAADRINRAKRENHRLICVGTTSCRALESASNASGQLTPGTYQTELFVYPGYSFKVVDSLITNFHLPGSSLLMLVSAFAGYELTMKAYQYAVEQQFRFFSYGDAMWIK